MALPCHRGVDSGVFPRSLISGPGRAVAVTSAALLGRVPGPSQGVGEPSLWPLSGLFGCK